MHKYGGSSVADLGKIQGVATRIAATALAGNQVVAVVSAMGNTTNELIALARQASANPDRRELDMLISVGERVTMALLAMALRDLGVKARSLTGSQSGIITDERHADAQVIEVRPARLLETIADGTVAIVAGFQGVSRAREVTTLGRGGSDTTAVVLAAALGAAHCEICSDVDGVWSADPRVVSDAAKIDELSLDEGLALARGGAKILFEDAVRYARDRGVTLAATSTFGPGSGTRLSVDVPHRQGAVAITSDTLVRIEGVQDADWTALVACGARVRSVASDHALVDMRNAHGGLPTHLQGEPVAQVQAIGSALGEHPDRWLSASSALSDAGIQVTHLGAHGDVVWWRVPVARLAEAVRVVHGALL